MTEQQPLLLYVPLLHKELVDKLGIRHTATSPIHTLWPGLPAPIATPEAPESLVYNPMYPYSPAQALACLHDWKHLATEQGPGALALRTQQTLHHPPLGPSEERDLAMFAKTGTLIAAPKDTKAAERTPERVDATASLTNVPALAEAQQRLLMAWLQEEHVIDIKKLIKQYHVNTAALTASLADTPQYPEPEPPMTMPPDPVTGIMADVLLPQGLLPDDASSLLPPWSFVLENMAPFLPDKCILFSADVRMWQDLQERGIHFEPILHENQSPQLQSTAETGKTGPRVLRQYLTLWEILGKKNPVPEAPWLNAHHEIRFVITQP